MKPKRNLVQVAEQQYTLYRDSQIIISRIDEQTKIAVNNFEFETLDVFEAVAFLLRDKKYNKSFLWDIKLTDGDREYVNPIRCLYWLSGGDEFWFQNDEISQKWGECNESYYEEFSDIIYDGLEQAETLMDIRKHIMTNLNLIKFWNFALSQKIIAFA